MTRAACVVLAALALAGCARHIVVERDQGEVDGEKSITSLSDRAWSIDSEPTRGAASEPSAGEAQ
jgi:hypothetical protein